MSKGFEIGMFLDLGRAQVGARVVWGRAFQGWGGTERVRPPRSRSRICLGVDARWGDGARPAKVSESHTFGY